ncbi:MAG: TIGR04149 family rSAM-modified RiPP [Candidatus Azobacteroides sp.]|nr:TIGR04149 family rSAM-modified RiPP [Candidatus Azobacteroides sp.]
MKTLKKIHLKSVSEFLSDKEMKLVVGGEDLLDGVPYDVGFGRTPEEQKECDALLPCGTTNKPCDGIACGEWCDGGLGVCRSWPSGTSVCKVCWHG